MLENEAGPVVVHIEALNEFRCDLTVSELSSDPFAIFECKRVGVEEGMKKGPQTIEKAKQGAYVARSVSCLQKVRLRNGRFHGIIERSDGSFWMAPYDEMLREVINSSESIEFEGFILTVGVVSNHGNWFTSENHNKELRVLAQSYDWLLFLTDAGLYQFIADVIISPRPELNPAKEAFLESYSGLPGKNRFTKVSMDEEADEALREYFNYYRTEIEDWFNVISPDLGTLGTLQADLRTLAT